MDSLALLRACACAGLLLAAPMPCGAQAAEPLNPLAAALDAAWQRSLAEPHSEGLRRRAQAEQALAARPWSAAPALELSQRRARSGGRETELGLSLPLWQLGQRAAQRAAAAGALELAEAERDAARLELAGTLREQAWALQGLQAELRAATARSESLDRLAQDVARRVQAGELAETDALAARAEALAAADQRAQARQALDRAQGQWRLQTGLAPTPPDAEAGAAPGVAHPLLRRAEARLAQARQQLELARRSGREPSELRLGWRQEQSERGAARQPSLQIGLRIPLEAERRNGVGLAEAETALRAAERELEGLQAFLPSARALAHAELERARAQSSSAAEQARLLRQRAELLQRSFQAGETALPELLRALAAAAQAEAGRDQSQATLGLAQARLHQASGLLP